MNGYCDVISYLYRPYRAGAYATRYTPVPLTSAVEEPPRDLVDRVLFDRTNALREKASALARQIDQRWSLYKTNMDGIDLQDCIISTHMDNLGDWTYRARREQGLEQEMHQLKKERRAERTAAWEDVQKLEIDLLDVIHEYRTAKRDEEVARGD